MPQFFLDEPNDLESSGIAELRIALDSKLADYAKSWLAVRKYKVGPAALPPPRSGASDPAPPPIAAPSPCDSPVPLDKGRLDQRGNLQLLDWLKKNGPTSANGIHKTHAAFRAILSKLVQDPGATRDLSILTNTVVAAVTNALPHAWLTEVATRMELSHEHQAASTQVPECDDALVFFLSLDQATEFLSVPTNYILELLNFSNPGPHSVAVLIAPDARDILAQGHVASGEEAMSFWSQIIQFTTMAQDSGALCTSSSLDAFIKDSFGPPRSEESQSQSVSRCLDDRTEDVVVDAVDAASTPPAPTGGDASTNSASEGSEHPAPSSALPVEPASTTAAAATAVRGRGGPDGHGEDADEEEDADEDPDDWDGVDGDGLSLPLARVSKAWPAMFNYSMKATHKPSWAVDILLRAAKDHIGKAWMLEKPPLSITRLAWTKANPHIMNIHLRKACDPKALTFTFYGDIQPVVDRGSCFVAKFGQLDYGIAPPVKPFGLIPAWFINPTDQESDINMEIHHEQFEVAVPKRMVTAKQTDTIQCTRTFLAPTATLSDKLSEALESGETLDIPLQRPKLPSEDLKKLKIKDYKQLAFDLLAFTPHKVAKHPKKKGIQRRPSEEQLVCTEDTVDFDAKFTHMRDLTDFADWHMTGSRVHNLSRRST